MSDYSYVRQEYFEFITNSLGENTKQIRDNLEPLNIANIIAWVAVVEENTEALKRHIPEVFSQLNQASATIGSLRGALEEIKRVSSNTCPYCGAVSPWDVTHKPDCIISKVISEALSKHKELL